jgi:rubrerythrin
VDEIQKTKTTMATPQKVAVKSVWVLEGRKISFSILEDGTPVFSLRDTYQALGKSWSGVNKSNPVNALGSKIVSSFLNKEIDISKIAPIEFYLVENGTQRALGYPATLLMDFAVAHVRANAAGKWNINGAKNHILQQCVALVTAASKRGIEAVLYEVAGYIPSNKRHHQENFSQDLQKEMEQNGSSHPQLSDAAIHTIVERVGRVEELSHQLEKRMESMLDAISAVSRQIQESKEEARSQFKILCFHQQDLVNQHRAVAATLRAPKRVKKTDQESLADAIHRFHGGKCGLCATNAIVDPSGAPLTNIWHIRSFQGRLNRAPKDVLPVCPGCNALLERPEIREASWAEFKNFQEKLAQVLGEEVDLFPDLKKPEKV